MASELPHNQQIQNILVIAPPESSGSPVVRNTRETLEYCSNASIGKVGCCSGRRCSSIRTINIPSEFNVLCPVVHILNSTGHQEGVMSHVQPGIGLVAAVPAGHLGLQVKKSIHNSGMAVEPD